MKKIIFLTILAFSLFGCSGSNDSTNDIDKAGGTRNDEETPLGDYDVYQYFIQEYIVPSKVEIKAGPGGLYLDVSGESLYTTMKDHPTFERAKELAEFYGDTSFNRENSPFANSPLAYPIDKITISCDADFDAEHPAGKPLDDVVQLEFMTFYEYINNGYELPADIPSGNRYGNDKVIHLLNFEDINAEVATLVNLLPFSVQWINVTPLIHFASKPETLGEYNFVLEMTTNGKTLKTTFTHTFE